MQPRDYVSPLLQVQQGFNPAQAFTQGQQVGQNLLNAQRGAVENQQQDTLFQQAQTDRASLIEAARQKAIAQAQASAQRAEAIAAVAKDPSTAGIAQLMVQFPDLADQYSKAHAALNDTEKQERQRQASIAYAAMESGAPDVAVKTLRENAEAYKATRPNDAAALEKLASTIEQNPGAGRTAIGLYLSSTMGPEQFQKTFSALEELPAVVAEKEAAASIKAQQAAKETERIVGEMKYTRAQTNRLYAQTKNDADRLQFDRDKLTRETALAEQRLAADTAKLSAAEAKEVNETVRASVLAAESSAQAKDLAAKFRDFAKTPTFSGLNGKAVEAINRATGFTNDLSAARKQFAVVVNKKVLEDLPPGAASDRDISLMREGFPEATDDPARVAEFLEAYARVTDKVQAMKRVEAEYVAKNRSLGNATGSFVVDGVTTQPGESYLQFIERKNKGATAPAVGSAPSPGDFSKLSDEELQRIASGG